MKQYRLPSRHHTGAEKIRGLLSSNQRGEVEDKRVAIGMTVSPRRLAVIGYKCE